MRRVLQCRAWITGGAAAIAIIAGAATGSRAETIYALLETGAIARIDSAAPGTIVSRQSVSGLQPGEMLLAIDYRPLTSRMYGLGSTGRLYQVNPQTGAAAAVGSPFALPLDGSEFGFDFNPRVDRVRITSDAGQNLRVQPDTGQIVDADASMDGVQADGRLKYAAGDRHEGLSPAVVASAYTNNFAGTASTSLLDLDRAKGALSLQNPPNDGILNTVALLSIPLTGTTGFDISTRPAATAYLTTRTGSLGAAATLYTLDTSTGQATAVGDIGDEATPVEDIAVYLCRPDFDKDEDLDMNDFLAFQAAWRARDARADYNVDGKYNVNDFIAYQTSWRLGCQ